MLTLEPQKKQVDKSADKLCSAIFSRVEIMEYHEAREEVPQFSNLH